MNGAPKIARRLMAVAMAGIVIAVLTACTGRGGGYLPAASPTFTGPATFGFNFKCERSSGSTNPNAPAGRLRLQLSYADHGDNPLGSRFSIQGFADPIDPVLESAVCIGQNPPPDGNKLIFLGRFRLTTPAPAGFPSSCSMRGSPTNTLCRFEVIVQDNNQSAALSADDFFSIKLSTDTEGPLTEFPPDSVFYARAGLLQGGNISVD